MSYFDNDDWQPADWLNALDRLAVTPPLEEIPVSSKMLESSSKTLSPTSRAALDAVTEMAVQWHWPLPRMVSDERPAAQEIILVLHENEAWVACLTSHDRNYYYQLGDRYEERFLLSPSVVWLPLPPNPEVQA